MTNLTKRTAFEIDFFMAAQPKTLDSTQVYSLAGHQGFYWIIESCFVGNFWPPEILRVFLAAGAFYRGISAFALARYRGLLKG
jgi:hypothetical protein